MLDAAGGRVAESRHYPYGAVRWTWPEDESTFPTDYRFTGQRDVGLGLTHMGARFLDIALGRWLSADTIVPEPGNPQSLNRYSWVLGNPLRFIDPTGHFTEEELINWGIYTAEELKWLVENQSDWYNLLMAAIVGDAFAFTCNSAGGIGQFLLDDQGGLYIGGAFWTEEAGIQTQGGFQDWASAVGLAKIQRGILAPEEKIVDQWPNPHIQLSGNAAEANAGFVFAIDVMAMAFTYGGYFVVLLDTVAAPMDPAGKVFGLAVAKFGSGLATVSVLDALVTSDPNSRGFGVSFSTWLLGWPPSGLVFAPVQVAYDLYTLERIKMQNRERAR